MCAISLTMHTYHENAVLMQKNLYSPNIYCHVTSYSCDFAVDYSGDITLEVQLVSYGCVRYVALVKSYLRHVQHSFLELREIYCCGVALL